MKRRPPHGPVGEDMEGRLVGDLRTPEGVQAYLQATGMTLEQLAEATGFTFALGLPDCILVDDQGNAILREAGR